MTTHQVVPAKNATTPGAGLSPSRMRIMQRKLIIGASSDPLEQEADRVADQVFAAPASLAVGGVTPKVQRFTGQPTGQADTAPTSVEQALATPGRPLVPALRQDMEQRFGHDFSRVRVRSGAVAEQSAREVSATAYTIGHNIVFGAGRFAPETNEGRRLIAHELTHIIQQSGGATAIQRTPAADLRWRQDVNAARYRGQLIAHRIRIHTKLSKEARAKINSELAYFEGAAKEAYVKEVRPALLAVTEIEMLPEQLVPGMSTPMGSDSGNPDPTTSDPAVFFNRALSDPSYIDNSIKEVNFFGAELAIIHYKDGSKLELGLVPKWMKPPFVEVDYHTPREDYKPLHNPGKSFSFFRDSDLQNVPRNMPWADVQTNYGRPVSFSREGQSGRFVPSIVNMLTAPNLCKVLLDSERRFVAQADEVAEWGAQVAGVIAWMPVGGWVKGPANFVKGAGTVARWPQAIAARKLASEMDNLLKTGGVKTITVEGVVFTDVRAVAQGRSLAVSRFSTHVAPALRGQGQGSLINAAFEEAAVAAARMSGLKTVTIDVGVIVNPGWRVLLESRGYVKTMTQTADGFSNSWVKTIKL